MPRTRTLSPLTIALELLLAVVPKQAHAQTQDAARLAPILHVAWGQSADSVQRQVLTDGWTFVTVDQDSDHVFRGAVDGVEAIAFVTFAADRLTAIQINLSPHPSAGQTFAQVMDSLASENGPAVISSETMPEYHPVRFCGPRSRGLAFWPACAATGGSPSCSPVPNHHPACRHRTSSAPAHNATLNITRR
ncbi:MAG: hypothetical protein U0163_03655 [Gemmatimonadaceae bacterium]